MHAKDAKDYSSGKWKFKTSELLWRKNKQEQIKREPMQIAPALAEALDVSHISPLISYLRSSKDCDCIIEDTICCLVLLIQHRNKISSDYIREHLADFIEQEVVPSCTGKERDILLEFIAAYRAGKIKT